MARIALSRTVHGAHIKQRTEFRFYLFLGLMLLWVWVQSLAMLEMLPGVWVQRLLTFKNLSSLGPVVLGTFLYFDKIRIRPLAIPPLLFAVYTFANVSVNIILQGFAFSSLYPTLMYFVWAWGLFVVIPSVIDTPRKLAIFLRWAIWGTVAIVILGSVWAILAGQPIFVHSGHSYSAVRYIFGFRHPGYVAHLFLVIFLGELILRNLSAVRFERRSLVLLSIVTIVLLIMADSRTNILMMLTSLLTYWIIRTERRSAWILVLWAVSVLLVLWLIWMPFANSSLPAYMPGIISSSGRFRVWGYLLSDAFDNGAVGRLLVGYGYRSTGGLTILSTIGGEVAETAFRISRWDNVYLEMLVTYGLVGLGMFLWIFFKLLRTAFCICSEPALTQSVRNNIFMAIAIIIGSLIYVTTVSGIPSTGNLLNIVLLSFSISTIMMNNEMDLIHC